MTMAISKYCGDEYVIPYAAGGSDIAEGDVVVIGSLLGVAVTLIPANTTGPVRIGGPYKFAKAAGVITQGDDLFWNDSTHVASKTATVGFRIGPALETVVSGATTVLALLQQSGTVKAATQLAITDNSAGAASDTIAAGITDAVAKNAVATLAERFNTLRTNLRAAGIMA